MFHSDDNATVWLVIDGARTPEWRADFNAHARSERVPVEAWWLEGETVLQVDVIYRAESFPSDVFQTLSDAVQLLDGTGRVPPPRVEKPASDGDTRHAIEIAVETWWRNYQRFISPVGRSA